MSNNQEVSANTKTIITVLFLIFLYPIGVVVMWFWTRWRAWVKILITLPIFLFLFLIILISVLAAINPAKQFSTANNTQRQKDVNAVLNAVNQYMNDYGGDISGLNIVTFERVISNGAAGVGNSFCTKLVSEYISSLPADPLKSDLSISESECINGAWDTGYTIQKNANNTITVSAPVAELGQRISATR